MREAVETQWKKDHLANSIRSWMSLPNVDKMGLNHHLSNILFLIWSSLFHPNSYKPEQLRSAVKQLQDVSDGFLNVNFLRYFIGK